jgi:hypothetical protein
MTTADNTTIQPVEGSVGEMLISLTQISADDLADGTAEAIAMIAELIDAPSVAASLGFSDLNLQERRDVAGCTFIALAFTGSGSPGLRRQAEAISAGTLTMGCDSTRRPAVARALSRVAEVVDIIGGEHPAEQDPRP